MARALATFATIFAALWLCFYRVYRHYPYLQLGITVLTDEKFRAEVAPHLLKRPNASGVLFFGNSKVLCGVLPDQFDNAMEAAGKRTESYNLGLPGYWLFVDRLEKILKAGNIPRYIVVTFPWAPDSRERNLLHPILHDAHAMDVLFPFRHLLHNMILAAVWSMQTNGSLDFANTNKEIVQRLRADRGYFVMQYLHYPGSVRLPPDFKSVNDHPTKVEARDATTREGEFHRLLRLLDTYHIQCLMVPMYYRVHEFAAPPEHNQRLLRELASYPEIKVLGPDYVRLDNRYFCDISHLNPDGAHVYTEYLANLIAPYVQ